MSLEQKLNGHFQEYGGHVYKWGDTRSLPELSLAGMESGTQKMHELQDVFMSPAGRRAAYIF
jgi:hypothetical protein